MLRNTSPYEAVIVEYGFLDNTKDAAKLKNNYKQYALDVVDAVLDYKGFIPDDVDYYIVKKVIHYIVLQKNLVLLLIS